MNSNLYRLIYSRVRLMWVAVADFATGHGGASVERTREMGALRLPNLRAMALAALALFGVLAPTAYAQIVAAPGSGAQVVQTRNGLPQVNIARPSGAGVSINNYSQFDVQRQGAILNNSASIVNTQQAGYVNGNPNLAGGNSARIIVNQVMSAAPSQFRGALEVAGARAQVVIASPSGIVVDGGNFINTSRAVLTTGTPNYGPNGSLAGYTVNNGLITVQGAGLNASNVDQVDLISRAIKINSALYANNVNAIAGANVVDHETLNATPIAGDGPAPSVAIDVAQLGGMYSNRIFLASNAYGVGVNVNGILASQAGDMTLLSNGRLVLAGRATASGDIHANAAQGIDNSGTTYARGNLDATTGGMLNNSGIMAAQQNAAFNAAGVASTGTLGAGVNDDGTMARTGDLSVVSSGAVSASGRNQGGGNATIQGASVNLAGSNTSANDAVTLSAMRGDLNVSSATTTAGGALSASAAGTLINDGGKASGGSVALNAGAVSNVNGQVVSQSKLDAQARNALNNRGGLLQAGTRETIQAGSLDNTGGKITSLNGDGIGIKTTGALVNGAGGTIGTNGALDIDAGTIKNAGQLSALDDLTAHAQSIDNNGGSMTAGATLDAKADGALSNAGGSMSGAATKVSGASIDNSNGSIDGDSLDVSTSGDLKNVGGKLTQYGAGDQTISAGGTLDNSNGGAIASNAQNLTVNGASIKNDKGTIQHAGAGTLALNAKGALSNVGGSAITNGALAARVGGAFDMRAARASLTARAIRATRITMHR